ncbi:hypothetical protein [Rhizobium sp. BK176]|uniref:hypothetical protein n=1 Tax=Rhizobium sp. BK176 TaxID=2587071 RepID=UPI002167BADC|nr:hypothetical protein [Rhizobium sp. BK176]MCS4090230.1 hypothetical protein [Rhizobium sp. BK176]
MQIVFEVPVVLQAKPGRAVNERIVVGYEAVAIEIPVMSEQEAPVALRYRRTDGVEAVEEFRSHDGRLYHDIEARPYPRIEATYRRHRSPDGLFDRQMEAIAVAIKQAEMQSNRTGLPAYKQMHPALFADAVKRCASQCKLEPVCDMELRGNGVEQAIARQVDDFRRNIRGMIVVGDRFHLPEAEPLMAMVPVWAGHVECRAIRAGTPPDSLANQGYEVSSLGYFRFDEFERMEAEAPVVATGGMVGIRVADVEVIDPTVLGADTDMLTLAGLAQAFTRYFASSLVVDENLENDDDKTNWMVDALSKVSPEQFVIYKRLLRGLEVAHTSGETDELEAAVFHIVESAPGSAARSAFVYEKGVGQRIRDIVRRWNDREVTLDHGFTPSWKP